WKDRGQPDAALLELADLTTVGTAAVVRPLELAHERLQRDTEELMREYILAGHSRIRPGRIDGWGAGYQLDGRFGNFNHWQLRTVKSIEQRRYFWLIRWPLFGLRFSRKGDSGAWVVPSHSQDQ